MLDSYNYRSAPLPPSHVHTQADTHAQSCRHTCTVVTQNGIQLKSGAWSLKSKHGRRGGSLFSPRWSKRLSVPSVANFHQLLGHFGDYKLFIDNTPLRVFEDFFFPSLSFSSNKKTWQRLQELNRKKNMKMPLTFSSLQLHFSIQLHSNDSRSHFYKQCKIFISIILHLQENPIFFFMSRLHSPINEKDLFAFFQMFLQQREVWKPRCQSHCGATSPSFSLAHVKTKRLSLSV